MIPGLVATPNLNSPTSRLSDELALGRILMRLRTIVKVFFHSCNLLLKELEGYDINITASSPGATYLSFCGNPSLYVEDSNLYLLVNASYHATVLEQRTVMTILEPNAWWTYMSDEYLDCDCAVATDTIIQRTGYGL